jgi:hypothetical protein
MTRSNVRKPCSHDSSKDVLFGAASCGSQTALHLQIGIPSARQKQPITPLRHNLTFAMRFFRGCGGDDASSYKTPLS